MLKYFKLLAGVLVLAALVAACAAPTPAAQPTAIPPTVTPLPPPPTPTKPPAPTAVPATPTPAAPAEVVTTVNVVAKEAGNSYIFEVDKSAVPAGKVRFEFKNAGKMTHEIWIYPTQDISAMMALKRADKKLEETDYIKGVVGEAEDVDPGKSASIEATLKPGFYELACFVRSKNPDGSTYVHLNKGQFFTLAVTGPGGPSANVATAASTMTVQMMPGSGDLSSSWLFVPDRLVVNAGDVSFKVTNNMKEEHDFTLYPVGDVSDFVANKLKTGKGDYDSIKATELMEDLEAGKTDTKTIKLTPGVWAAVCLMVGKNADGSSFIHYERGQRFVFTVK
ncbi:MAG: cupredoxin domain-containing protein [Acidobacteria bacterium]|nr:cupredoxin domain-containing protein [Acidobacteriota bacterium]